jgi:sugar phosphate isomerase/epimerase
MRFGIIAMQVDKLVPANLPQEQVLAHIAGFDHASLVRELAELGFNPIELSGDLGFILPHTFAQPAIDNLAALKEQIDLEYTIHLPLWSVEPSTMLTPVRLGSVQALIDNVLATRPLEPQVYVLHATGALAAEFSRMQVPELARAYLLRQFQNAARESIQSLLSETGIPSRQLAIETIEFPFDLTLELAEELDISICFDTGHVLTGFSGVVDFFEALDLCLPRLAEVHLHDAPLCDPGIEVGYGLDHQPLGTGDLDVRRLLDRLIEVNFDGPLVFELSTKDAIASLQVIHNYLPQFVDPDLITKEI